jgi:hypothetical protein
MVEWFRVTASEQSLHAWVRSVIQRMHTDYQRQHGIFDSQERMRIPLQESGWSYYPGSLYAFRQSGRMEKESFSRLILAVLFACTRVDTCHPWNCMRSTRMHHPCTSSPCQKLRIKHKCHMFFWNNSKILFLGLSPLGLAPRLNT